MESISVFEIIKVGIGPSSSHTMGPWNAASSFLNLIKRERQISEVKEVFVEFFGSLAKTGIGHGTDIAGMLGLSGENFKTIDTTTIDEKIEIVKELEKYECEKSTEFFSKLNDSEKNEQIRRIAFNHLQSIGKYVKLRKNFDGKKKQYICRRT